jgi:hypothetical protein
MPLLLSEPSQAHAPKYVLYALLVLVLKAPAKNQPLNDRLNVIFLKKPSFVEGLDNLSVFFIIEFLVIVGLVERLDECAPEEANLKEHHKEGSDVHDRLSKSSYGFKAIEDLV